jgi:Na+-transporting NADH:ubiquinone oxidoreductase subunit NqrD
MGLKVLPDSFIYWTIMIMAPGAFFTLGILVWAINYFSGKPEKAEGEKKQ